MIDFPLYSYASRCGLILGFLTDNGTEFSDPDGIELYRPDPIHSSTKLLRAESNCFIVTPTAKARSRMWKEATANLDASSLTMEQK